MAEKEIVNYSIITGENAHELVKLVAEALKKGWVPQGGVCTDKNGYPMQAIVKYRSSLVWDHQ